MKDMPHFLLIRVGTKVFAFVFSRKFSRNYIFVFAKNRDENTKLSQKFSRKVNFCFRENLAGKQQKKSIIHKNLAKEIKKCQNDTHITLHTHYLLRNYKYSKLS
jgi:hypothetical protein